jgi:ABC-type Fe3+-siderophore transport system permease subunit
VVGFQILSLGLHAKTYSWSRRFDRHNRALAGFYRRFQLETGLLLGAGLAFAGVVILTVIVAEWVRSDLLPLPHPEWVSFAATLVIMGCSTLFSSLFISAMSMSRPQDPA